jgi:hypothetical protein
MITYEDIKKANETIKTTDIKGKNYAEVNQRIKAFRMVYPTGTIETKLVSNENGVCIFKAVVGFIDDNNNLIILGTGNAYEKEGSSFINKTSYIENCETSAVGRALGMAGFGIDVSIASAEEVQNAIQQQDDMKAKELGEQLLGNKEIEILEATVQKYNKTETDTMAILMKYGYKDFKEVKKKDYVKIGNELSIQPV